MDSDALNTFLMVHHRGGISNAAKALHRTQPAISRRIALLEQELGMPLFERVAGRTVLSDAGRVMVPYAERAVAAAQDAENAVRALARPDSGPVALAVVGTLAGGQLSAIMKRFAEGTSGCQFDAAHGDQRRGQRPDPARRGDDRAALRPRRLARSRLRIAVCRAAAGRVRAGSSARRPARQEIGRSARRALDRISGHAGRREITASHVFALFQTHGLGEVEWTPVDSLTAQKRLVEAGLGIALLSESNAAEELDRSAIATIARR